MESRTTAPPDVIPTDVAVRIRTIRARLPGQLLRERLEMALLDYGPLYSLAEIRQRVGEVLPRRLGYVRGATLEPIEQYREPIPDEALLKFDDATRSGVFSKFWVATPTYYQERQVDPWIVAEVEGTDRVCRVDILVPFSWATDRWYLGDSPRPLLQHRLGSILRAGKRLVLHADDEAVNGVSGLPQLPRIDAGRAEPRHCDLGECGKGRCHIEKHRHAEAIVEMGDCRRNHRNSRGRAVGTLVDEKA